MLKKVPLLSNIITSISNLLNNKIDNRDKFIKLCDNIFINRN